MGDNQLWDEQILYTLNFMKSNGSKTLPNNRTFEIILVGIASNDGIKDPIKLSLFVLDELMPQYNISASLCHFTSVMLICMNAKNVKIATDLILNHKIVLADKYLVGFYLNAFADADIDEINNVLQQLLDSRSIAVEQVVKFIVDYVLSTDPESIAYPDCDTYSVMFQLCQRQCGANILREYTMKFMTIQTVD